MEDAMFDELSCSGLLANLASTSSAPDSSAAREISLTCSNTSPTVLPERNEKIFSRAWSGASRHPAHKEQVQRSDDEPEIDFSTEKITNGNCIV